MSGVSRAQRVAGLIQELVSNLLHRDISDPRLQMVTITQVRVTKDLRIARIYFASAGGKGSAEETAQGFESAAGFIKRRLGPVLGLRYVPELEFYYDESFDQGARVDQLLKSIASNSHEPNHSED
jgi:ribosome-binding factor A